VINEAIGKRVEIDGQVYLETRPDFAGHALYGPYEPLDPGKYVAEFSIKLVEHQYMDGDLICGVMDVAANFGSFILSQAPVCYTQIRDSHSLRLVFDVNERREDFEFRVFVNSGKRLLIADKPIVRPAEDENHASTLPVTSSSFFNENIATFAQLFSAGVQVKISGQDVILKDYGVSFFVRCHDDMNFIGEVFIRNTYNIFPPRPACVIDVGMNIGFTSLRLAIRDDVREVHAFEPFKTTFDRASANVALNPQIASKIQMNNFGLSDRDDEVTVQIDSTDSGSYSVTGSGRGDATRIEIRDAAKVIGPIIQRATAKKLLVIIKVDCEGSEFAVFKSLRAAGLLSKISAFMVEWHLGWGPPGDLTEPLVSAGFTVFDISPRSTNGFFYAVKTEL
jgi:FkbM family methyltransferase